MKLSYNLFRQTDNLSKALQSSDLAASDGLQLAKAVISAIREMRREQDFDLLWESVKADAEVLGIQYDLFCTYI